jgi:hypothetical protein
MIIPNRGLKKKIPVLTWHTITIGLWLAHTYYSGEIPNGSGNHFYPPSWPTDFQNFKIGLVKCNKLHLFFVITLGWQTEFWCKRCNKNCKSLTKIMNSRCWFINIPWLIFYPWKRKKKKPVVTDLVWNVILFFCLGHYNRSSFWSPLLTLFQTWTGGQARTSAKKKNYLKCCNKKLDSMNWIGGILNYAATLPQMDILLCCCHDSKF